MRTNRALVISLPIFFFLCFCAFNFNICHALYGPSSPVVQLNPSNFKAKVIRVIPYSAVQLFAYETYKKIFRGNDGELSVIGRLAAGACAGMTSTFITYPLDVLRLQLVVEPGYRTMSKLLLPQSHAIPSTL